MYVSGNPKTKKELKLWLSEGRSVSCFSPGPFPCPQNGEIFLEGPHYPKPHSWYAQGEMKEGRLISVK